MTGGMSSVGVGSTPVPPPEEVRIFASGVLEEMVTDGDGALYVLGSTGDELVPGRQVGLKDAFSARLDGVGTPSWMDQFGTSSEDAGGALTWTSWGLLYAAGHSEGGFVWTPNGLTDIFVRVTDGDGSSETVIEFGSSGDDYAEAVAEGPNGKLYLVGYADGRIGDADYAGGIDIFVAEVNPAGNLGWIRQYGSAGDDYAKDVVVTPDGSLFVVGYTDGDFGDGSPMGGYDGFVLRLGAGGDVSFSVRFATEQNDFVSSASLGPTGRLFVAGRTEGVLGASHGGSDPFVAEVDVAGAVAWIHQFGTPEHETTFDLDVSPSGDIYVAGNTLGFLAAPNQGHADSFVRKMTPDGDEVWTSQWGSEGYDTVQCLATTSDSLFVAGELSGSSADTPGLERGLFIARMDL